MRSPTTLLLLVLPAGIHAVNNGLARTPPMGWNNWNSLGCDVSESLLLDTAQVLVHSGLRDIGYNYVVLVTTLLPHPSPPTLFPPQKH